jgi:hypothetical protein
MEFKKMDNLRKQSIKADSVGSIPGRFSSLKMMKKSGYTPKEIKQFQKALISRKDEELKNVRCVCKDGVQCWRCHIIEMRELNKDVKKV